MLICSTVTRNRFENFQYDVTEFVVIFLFFSRLVFATTFEQRSLRFLFGHVCVFAGLYAATKLYGNLLTARNMGV